MRKRLAPAIAAAAVAAAVGPLGSSASAATCFGVISFRDTYVCVVRAERPDATLIQGPGVLVPAVCLGVECTSEQWLYLPDAILDGGEVVLYYNGTCYYVEDGVVRDAPAPNENSCP